MSPRRAGIRVGGLLRAFRTERWIPAFAGTSGEEASPAPACCARLAVCCLLVLGVAAWRIAALGPAPLGKDIAFSTRVVDRDGRLLRAYATAEGRWRLPARVGDVDPRFFAMLFAYEDKRFRAHHGVDPLAIVARRRTACDQRAYPVRRLDIDHAGGAAARAAQQSQPCRQAAPGSARRRDRTRAEQGRDPFALSRSGAVWRQHRGRAGRFAQLFRQRATAADARRSRAARSTAAIAGSAPTGSLGRGRARGA